MFARASLICLSSLALFACGIGDKDDADNSPLTIVKSYPLPNQFNVGIAETIWVQLNKDLDPTSVTDENIHLMPGDSNMDHEITVDSGDPDDTLDIVSGYVEYDAANRILYFTPKTHMHNGTTYHIRVHDVRYANDAPLENGTEELVFSFTTLHNHEVRRENYSSKTHELSTYEERTYVDNLLSGKKELKESRRYDAAGNLTLITRYDDFLPGTATKARLVYLKPDGKIIFYQKDILVNGQIFAHATYNDPGGNLEWGDDDDIVSKWSDHDHDHGKHQITKTYNAIGDGAPWSNDEATRAQNFELKYVALMEHNPDAIAQGTGVFPHRYIFYSDLGSNGEIDVDTNGNPSPADDIISSWYKRDYDNNGKRIRSWNMRGTEQRPSGNETNATIFTDANQAYGMAYYEYDQYGHLTRITTFADPGGDNDWLTHADNKISSYYEYQYDNFNLVSRSIYALQDDNTPVLLSVHIYDAVP